MSISEISIHKCTSCGHNIARGRLTCNNCGAASPLGDGESLCNYDYYLECDKRGVERLSEVLNNLYSFATKVTNFYSGNEVTGEAKMNDFEQYYSEITKIQKGGWARSNYRILEPTIRLFMTHHVINKDTAFDRFIAIEDGVLMICEINSIARMYFQAIHDVQLDLEVLERKKGYLELRPLRLEEARNMVAASLTQKDAAAARLLLAENRLAKWEKKSWLGKMFSRKPNIEKVMSLHSMTLEVYEAKRLVVKRELEYINTLKTEIVKLEETLGFRDK